MVERTTMSYEDPTCVERLYQVPVGWPGPKRETVKSIDSLVFGRPIRNRYTLPLCAALCSLLHLCKKFWTDIRLYPVSCPSILLMGLAIWLTVRFHKRADILSTAERRRLM
jgi:hypothetical protein